MAEASKKTDDIICTWWVLSYEATVILVHSCTQVPEILKCTSGIVFFLCSCVVSNSTPEWFQTALSSHKHRHQSCWPSLRRRRKSCHMRDRGSILWRYMYTHRWFPIRGQFRRDSALKLPLSGRFRLPDALFERGVLLLLLFFNLN